MTGEGVANCSGRVGPFNTGVESFGVLAEDDHADGWFFESTGGLLANEVQRIAGEADAGTHADIESELLAHGDDRAEIAKALATKFGLEFGVGGLLGFRGDSAEESEFVFGEQLDGALRKGIAFIAPA